MRVLFSGGVSEYLYEHRGTQSYGDLGILLGQQIRELTSALSAGTLPVETLSAADSRHRHRCIAVHRAGERQHYLHQTP